MKDRIITAVLLLIMVLNFRDVLTDLSLSVPLWHIIEESLIVALAGCMAVYLIMDIRRRSRHVRDLSDKLAFANTRIDSMTEQFRLAKEAFTEAVDAQFDGWELTPSEKDVARLLLKGLSIRNIAEIRATKEKTVRQQASSIYAKSGLEGRYALSAWFFGDILDPQGTVKKPSHNSSEAASRN